MSYFVYIHIIPNNKKYIGVTTKPVKDRWKNGWGYFGQKHFFNAISKYGWDNIEHKVFEVDTESEMFYLERYLISYYQTTNPKYGYNKSTGGESGGRGVNISYDEKIRISNKLKGRKSPNRKMIEVDGIIYQSIQEAYTSLGICKRAFEYAMNHSSIYKGHRINKIEK